MRMRLCAQHWPKHSKCVFVTLTYPITLPSTVAQHWPVHSFEKHRCRTRLNMKLLPNTVSYATCTILASMLLFAHQQRQRTLRMRLLQGSMNRISTLVVMLTSSKNGDVVSPVCSLSVPSVIIWKTACTLLTVHLQLSS